MAKEKRELGLLALGSAIDRAREAQSDADTITFFASVAEAMWWVTMLDETLWQTDSYESNRASDTGDLLLGIRYARNRQVHDAKVTGMQGNPLLARTRANGEPWSWRLLDDPEVPAYEPRGVWGERGEHAYRDRMATHEVLSALVIAADFLNAWVGELNTELAQQRDQL